MEVETTVRVANTVEALERLLAGIESGTRTKPDWINLQAHCRLDKLAPKELGRTIARLHGCVLRGFRANNVDPGGRKKRREFWRIVAQGGFQDFSDLGWQKCYDSPFVENYDYVTPYRKGGVDALDPYQVYSAVLGTHDYSVEDFVNTELCGGVKTIAEPMAGSAEFAYHGHFRYPDFRYVMFDLDRKAKAHVMKRNWLPQAKRNYLIADVLDEGVWKQVADLTTGESLAYIGKQSHHLFDAKQLYALMKTATQYVDYFMLETPQVSLVSDMDTIDELTRPEMEDQSFRVGLVDEPGGAPNPLTNEMAFRLDVWDSKQRRTLFRYPSWTSWAQPILVTLARLLDLRVLYYHSEFEDFVPVDQDVDDSDCLENVTFMLFTRHGA